jgi:hypothetical protein
MRRFRLDRIIERQRTAVAAVWNPRSQITHQGGVLEVDAEQVDDVVAVLTGMVILRKQSQKTYEYSVSRLPRTYDRLRVYSFGTKDPAHRLGSQR